MVSGEEQNNATMLNVQVQLGEIKGILQTLVSEHARRLADSEEAARRLRVDLTAVKDESSKALADFMKDVQLRWENGTREGSKAFAELTGTLSAHTTTIADIKEDVRTVQDKQHNALAKASTVLSPIIAVGALIWSIVTNH